MNDLITALNALDLHSFDGNHSEYVLVDDLAKVIPPHAEAFTARLKACELTVLNYKRMFASGEHMLDDDHEAYEACQAAIRKAKE